jgi:hypothetical protein
VHHGCSRDVGDQCGSHKDLLTFEPGVERVVAPIVQVGVELVDYLQDCGTVVLHHIHPSLDVQHYSYPRGALIEICYVHTPLHYYLASLVVGSMSTPGLILPKVSMIVNMVVIAGISASANLSNQSLRVQTLG